MDDNDPDFVDMHEFDVSRLSLVGVRGGLGLHEGCVKGILRGILGLSRGV
jgi:hypothetical protein